MPDLDSSTEESQVFGTQQFRDVFTCIRDQYGHLAKDIFKNELVTRFAEENDLVTFRQSLYDLALKDVPDTPSSTLVVRKYCQGGATVKSKLAEDIFVLYHYIQGDLSGDIYKLFPDREKSRLKRLASDNRPPSLVNQSDLNITMTTRDPEATPDKVNGDFNATMISFCREFLTEMRINRDKLAEDIREIKEDTKLIRNLKIEIADIKNSYVNLEQRVITLEKGVKEKDKMVKNLTENCNQLKAEIRNYVAKEIHELTTIAQTWQT